MSYFAALLAAGGFMTPICVIICNNCSTCQTSASLPSRTSQTSMALKSTG
jgi:hypothetical protein